MTRKIVQKKAQSTMEYIAVLILIMSVFFVFGYYMKRAVSGRWKASGDMWGQGRVFDGSGPLTGTEECAYVDWNTNDGAPATITQWYSVDCYKSSNCARRCFGFAMLQGDCHDCISGCRDVRCDQ